MHFPSCDWISLTGCLGLPLGFRPVSLTAHLQPLFWESVVLELDHLLIRPIDCILPPLSFLSTSDPHKIRTVLPTIGSYCLNIVFLPLTHMQINSASATSQMWISPKSPKFPKPQGMCAPSLTGFHETLSLSLMWRQSLYHTHFWAEDNENLTVDVHRCPLICLCLPLTISLRATDTSLQTCRLQNSFWDVRRADFLLSWGHNWK